MNKRNLFILVVVIVVLAVGGFFVFRQRSGTRTSASDLQTAQVERGTLVASVSGAGTMASPQTATLTWQASGTIGQVNVSVGQVVNAGDVVVELDPNRADPAMLQAQVDLINAQQNLETLLAGPTEQQLTQARLAVIQAQQAVTATQRSLNSVLNPAGQNLIDAVSTAKLTLDTAQANLQLANVSSDVAALQSQVFVTNWYRRRLEDLQAKYGPNPDNQGWRDELQRAQNDYQAQLDRQLTLELRINTDKANKTNAAATAQATYDQAMANLQAAQRGPDAAQVALYQAKLAAAQADLAQAQSDLAELQAGPDPQDVAAARARVAAAQAVVDAARLVAPFRGTVVAVHNRVGDEVQANQSAVEIADLSSLEIEVNIVEVDINLIAVGQAADLTVDAAPGQTFQGQVTQVAYLGTSQQGVVNFPVTIVITNPDPALKPGMTGAVAIVTESRANVLMVPNRAIRAGGGQRTVTVLFEGQQISVPVTLGLTTETMSEIVSGQVREGDTVVINTTASTNQNQGQGGFLFGGGPFGP